MKAKRPAGMTQKRNPQDTTLRNTRASLKRTDDLQRRVDTLYLLVRTLDVRVHTLESLASVLPLELEHDSE